MKTNNHGEATTLDHSAALARAKHCARYQHGEWFAWQHKSGEWYVAKRSSAVQVEDAELNVAPASRVYLVGGGGPLSMTFTRFSASIVQVWAKSLGVGC